jgi:uncharacterized glyoxalase superfamily protein PhnB
MTTTKTTKKADKQLRRQPETLRLRTVNPALTASDLQRSIAWYRDVLGFTVGERWDEAGRVMGVEILAGAVRFMLNQDDFKKGRDRKKGEGMRLRCHTVQDIDKLAAQIQARGGVLDQGPKDMPWGERVFAISDPDGFKLSFIQDR